MKTILFGIILMISALQISQAQVVTPVQKSISFDEMLQPYLMAQANAERIAKARQEREAQYNNYINKAYKALNRGNRNDFITYTNYALNTGFYNAQVYYDRGSVFQAMEDYAKAKKEYKIAKKLGYYQAERALVILKSIRKAKRKK